VRRLKVRLWEVEKASSLIGDIVEVSEAAARADNIQEIAMFSGGGNPGAAAWRPRTLVRLM
jgi:hypothetical protein